MTVDNARSGIDVEGMDASVRPQDDLFGYVNGGWVASTEIPGDRGRFGTFDILRDRSQEDMLAILDAAAEPAPRASAGEQAAGRLEESAELAAVRTQVGALYASFMDIETIEAAGVGPLAEAVRGLIEAESARVLFERIGGLQREGAGGPLAAFVSTDKRASDTYITYLYQAGIGLPDEAYYRADEHAGVREAYRAHLARVFALLARDLPEVADALGGAEAAARSVFAFETALASHHWDRVSSRDAVATYTKMGADELAGIAPQMPWAQWLDGLGFPKDRADEFVVAMPSFVTGLGELVGSTDLAAQKSWAVWGVLRSWSPYLSREYDEAHFDFYGRTLSGTPRQRDRWRRGIALVDWLLGQAAGRLYVAEKFPPESKARVQELVANLIEAYRRDITQLDWMSGPTKERALAKLEAFTPKIGYPDSWRDYSGLRMDGNDLLGNVRRGVAFETDRDWAKLGGPVDRDEWFMNPQTVNAYYNPGMNEIVFPAAILQPPFFDAEADPAVNYGAIGSVIGHEIGHGFDDQGSRYDGEGNLADWWTKEDRERFDERARSLIAQYDGLASRDLPGETVSGALTVGENIGDLGGVTIAHLAYLISLGEEEAPVLDTLTGSQRFFIGWAQAWRGVSREEEARRLLAVDPHSPVDLRANIVRNLTEFYEAFGVDSGDGLWLEPGERVRIW